MEDPRSILIIQTAFIGDVILATALAESLHQRFPQTTIDFLLRKGNESLLQGHPFLREVLVFDKSQKYRNLIQLVRRIKAKGYSHVINVQRFATTGLMTVFSGASVKVGFDKNPVSFLFTRKETHTIGDVHEVERNHKLIDFLVGGAPGRPQLYPSTAQFEKVRSYKKKEYITISPASVWFTKQLPFEKWMEFLSDVPSHYSLYLLGADGDDALCQRIVAALPARSVTSLAGKLSLLESAALMKDAKMNYVNDSAPLHLASAMNAPVTAIYCSTVPSFGFGPLSDRSVVVETTEKLDCRPCGLHGFRHCPKGHFKCALTIRKEQLLKTL